MCRRAIKTPTQPTNIDEVKYARKGIVTILWDQLHQAYVQLHLAKRVDGSLNAFVSVEKPYILNIWVFWQPKYSLISIKHTKNTQRRVTNATKIVQRKQKRLFDGNGMNILSIISCKDTKPGAQLTLIDKNVIWKQSYKIVYYCK